MLHRALIPKSSNITCLACCPCTPVCASVHCAHHRGPSSQPCTARLAARHGTGGRGSLPLASQKPWEHKRSKYFTSGYVQRLHLQIFPVFSFFSCTSPASSEERWTEPCFPVIPDIPSNFMSSTKTKSTLKIKLLPLVLLQQALVQVTLQLSCRSL